MLAFECSSDLASVALLEQDRLIDESSKQGPARHNHWLLRATEKLLANQHLTINDVRAIAVGLGPGGFTGVRLAVSVVQGLIYGLRVPAVGVDSLAALALAAARGHGREGAFSLCVDARMQEVMVAQVSVREGDVLWSEPTRLLARQSAAFNEFVTRSVGSIRVGDGWSTADGADRDVKPTAAAVGWLAHQQLIAGASTHLAELLPRYLRGEEAWRRV